MLAVLLAPIYLLVNFYILRWLLRLIDVCFEPFRTKPAKTILAVIYMLVCTSMLTAFLLPSSPFQKVIAKIGNYWLGTFLYILLTVLLLDLFRMIVKHSSCLQRYVPQTRKTFIRVSFACICFVGSISLYGVYNARNIRTTRYDISIEAESPKDTSLKVVLVADLHMGYSIGYRQIEKMVDRINTADPDIVCIAGDMFDNHYESLDDPERIKAVLRSIKSRYGVYACYGNHDYEEKILAGFTFSSEDEVYIGENMKKLLEESQIRTLEDEAVLIDEKFYVVGRKDYSSGYKSGTYRKSAEELLQGLDRSKPVIMIDHQPRELEALSKAGVDLDLCGHTHDGQMFPGNLVTSFMWENACGYLKKGEMHNIVTSGVGIFGPYMRVGTKSEIVEINVAFH